MRSYVIVFTIGILFLNITTYSYSQAKQDVDRTKPVIGVCIPEIDSNYFSLQRYNLVSMLENAGYPTQFENAGGDQQKQNQQILAMAQAGVKIILVICLNPREVVPAVAKAINLGAKVIAVDMPIYYRKITAYITIDFFEVGKLQASVILSKIKEGNIVLLGGDPNDLTAHQIRVGQMYELITYLNAGTIKIVADRWIESWDPAIATVQMREILNESDQKIDGILAPNDGTSLGAIEALRERKLSGKIPISGMDATDLGCNAVMKGEMTFTILRDFRLLYPLAVDTAIRLAKNENVPDLLTKNISDYSLDTRDFGTIPCRTTNIQLIDKNNMKKLIVDSDWQDYDAVYKDIPNPPQK